VCVCVIFIAQLHLSNHCVRLLKNVRFCETNRMMEWLFNIYCVWLHFPSVISSFL